MSIPGEPPLEDLEAYLEWLEVKFYKNKDGSLTVPGELRLDSIGLTRLPDLSRVDVQRGFSCSHNKLTSLAGAPRRVGGFFSCTNNELANLEGATQDVGGNFSCSENKLLTLKGAPPGLRKRFLCHHNPGLKSLEHAPQSARDITSDFGQFKSWDEVPEILRVSDETRAAAAAVEKNLRDNLILREPMAIRHPWTLRKNPAF